MTTNQIPLKRLDSIESLRGVAALMIVLFHLVELAHLPLPHGLEFVRSHFGMGVPLFYTLSGFVLTFGYANKLSDSQSEVISFYVRRFFRIAPLFYVVLISWRGLGWLLWGWSDSGQSILLNITFLFGLVPGEHESLVMAGWSIGVEMLFYLIFPVLLTLLRGLGSTFSALILSWFISAAVSNAFTAAGLSSYAYMNVLTQMPFFVAGMLCYRVWHARNFEQGRTGWLYLAIALLLIILMVIDNRMYLALNNLRFGALHHNIWSIVFALLIYASCTLQLRFLTRGPLRWFGRRSFSAYLMHTLVIVFIIKTNIFGVLVTMSAWPAFLIGTIITMAMLSLFIYVTYRWIEAPGIALGNVLLAGGLKRAWHTDPMAARHYWGTDFLYRLHGKEESWLRRLCIASFWTTSLRFIALGALVFSIVVAMRFLNQPLVDIHAFRQTQTALTSYWMLKEGWLLAYQTPVAGYPWSIPFEFPIYQVIVAVLSTITGINLEAAGRLVSLIFLVACAWPAFGIAKRLNVPDAVPWVFCALLWSSPINVYWGRTFMIETTALLFAFACIPYGIDVIRRVGGRYSALLFVIFATASVLQKSTTGGPVLLFLFICTVFIHLRRDGMNTDALRNVALPVMSICISLGIGLGWAHYADGIKMANPFGSQLTSEALGAWNFGTLQQRLDLETWRLVIWERCFQGNAGGALGVILILLPLFFKDRYKGLAGLSLMGVVLFILPLLIFTNLHYVHEYYQVACLAFLLGALAIVIGGWLPSAAGTTIFAPILTVIIVVSNLVVFAKHYGTVTARTLEEQDPRTVQAYKIGSYLRAHTLPGTGLVVFGQEYSSEIAFQAQRKSITVPPWFKEYRQLWEQPQRYLGDVVLSAIVICPPSKEFPSADDLQERLAKEPSWRRVTVYGCELLLV